MKKTEFDKYAEKFRESMIRRNYSDRTIGSQLLNLTYFFKFLSTKNQVTSFTDITREMVEKYRVILVQRGLNLVTVYGYLQAVRNLFRFLVKENVVLFDITEGVEMPKLERRLPKNIPSMEEMDRILEQPDLDRPQEFRDRAILELMYSAGLRSCEITRVNIYDVDLKEGYLRIYGKGRKERIVPVGKIACSFIQRYLENIRPKFAKKADEKALFLSQISGKRISLGTMWPVVKEYIRRAGYDYDLHSIRHAFATHLLRKGAKIRYIQKMMGHSYLSTTQRYTEVVKTDLKRVHTATHPAGGRREIVRFKPVKV